jgi:hypothetical protein
VSDFLLFGLFWEKGVISFHLFSTGSNITQLGQLKIIRTGTEWNISALGYFICSLYVYTEVPSFINTYRKEEPLCKVKKYKHKENRPLLSCTIANYSLTEKQLLFLIRKF